MWWSTRRAHRRCRRLVARLDFPDPFDLTELCRRAGRARGRPIELVPASLSALGVSGLWLAADRLDYIWYEQNTSAPHREHVVLHELGHILCDHGGSGPAAQVLAALFPQLDPEVVGRMLARRHDAYTGVEELEAEAFAHEVRVRADRAFRPREDDEVTDRLGRVLGD
ncbi:ImmA/IrrE family metallo-endopeptidase [Saccharothrix obliqua]|uniref:ImmA/IrrE family metallo-endopeptidase n=1 Tax=Saccharothrix obliqua TaxID=2861747 RepID=UPI001C5E9938|nr:ImmA/IrrE family metallo-endopeptidase [Saccharothrix obliqua]MBW4717288.1 hypothetical protein [Saccharothrix obliqua]